MKRTQKITQQDFSQASAAHFELEGRTRFKTTLIRVVSYENDMLEELYIA